MKLDALDHPKTIDLAAQLGICLPQAIGHLELFWLFVGQKTPRGNVGRWSNAVIAYHAQWTGNPDDFVSALDDAGFIDKNEEHRYVVHDWADHMPRWVKAKLAKEKKTVVSSNSSKQSSKRDSKDDSSHYSADCSSHFKGREGNGKEVKGRKTPVEFASEPDGAVRDVFAYWQDELNHNRAKLDDKRKRKIKARLKDGYSADDLMAAIRGCKKSPHHMGENDTGTVYDDIELICRDGPHVDKFIRLDGQANRNGLSGSARKTVSAAQQWLEDSNASN